MCSDLRIPQETYACGTLSGMGAILTLVLGFLLGLLAEELRSRRSAKTARQERVARLQMDTCIELQDVLPPLFQASLDFVHLRARVDVASVVTPGSTGHGDEVRTASERLAGLDTRAVVLSSRIQDGGLRASVHGTIARVHDYVREVEPGSRSVPDDWSAANKLVNETAAQLGDAIRVLSERAA